MANQIDPRAVEKEIQRQQAIQNTIDAKVKAHQALTDSDIEFICPVAFKQTLSKKEKANLGLSKHYSFVPTSRVINDLRTMGWNPVDAVQVKARKKETNGYQKHMITFENDSYKTEGATEYPQLTFLYFSFILFMINLLTSKSAKVTGSCSLLL